MVSSKIALRGWNHSRRLLRCRLAKNASPSAGKPGNTDRTKYPSLILKVMPTTEETQLRLAEIPNLTVSTHTPLSRYTRFGIGGPADLFAETRDEQAFIAAVAAARESGTPVCVTGGGTNLIVSDQGFRGLVLRFSEDTLRADGDCASTAGAGAVLQDLVDFANQHGLKGLETLAGIPGWVGAAVYGNAGAYGHSISERVAVGPLFRWRRRARIRQRAVRFPLSREHLQTSQGVDDLPRGTAARRRPMPPNCRRSRRTF